MNPQPTNNTDEELRKAILLFDKSRGQTGADYVNRKITRQQADSEYEDDIATLISVAHRYAQKMILADLKKLEPLTHKGRGTILWEMDIVSDAINDRISSIEKELKDVEI